MALCADPKMTLPAEPPAESPPNRLTELPAREKCHKPESASETSGAPTPPTTPPTQTQNSQLTPPDSDSEPRISPVLPESLEKALLNPRDRSFILNLEKQLILFFQSPAKSHDLPPMKNAYYRLLAHQAADYYRLGHTVNVKESVITVFKAPPRSFGTGGGTGRPAARYSPIPGLYARPCDPAEFGIERLYQLVPKDDFTPVFTPQFVYMYPPIGPGYPGVVPNGLTSSVSSPGSVDNSDLEKKRARKQENYDEARQRIFQDFQGTNTESAEPEESLMTPEPTYDAVYDRGYPATGYYPVGGMNFVPVAPEFVPMYAYAAPGGFGYPSAYYGQSFNTSGTRRGSRRKHNARDGKERKERKERKESEEGKSQA